MKRGRSGSVSPAPTAHTRHQPFGSIGQSIDPQTELEVYRELEIGETPEIGESRRHPRFKLETEVRVYPRNAPVVRGHTVDISQSGISAILVVEVPIGEVVRLTFRLRSGDVDVHAVIRHRNAFRYGFQFLESESAKHRISRTCRELEMAEALSNSQAT